MSLPSSTARISLSSSESAGLAISLPLAPIMLSPSSRLTAPPVSLFPLSSMTIVVLSAAVSYSVSPIVTLPPFVGTVTMSSSSLTAMISSSSSESAGLVISLPLMPIMLSPSFNLTEPLRSFTLPSSSTEKTVSSSAVT